MGDLAKLQHEYDAADASVKRLLARVTQLRTNTEKFARRLANGYLAEDANDGPRHFDITPAGHAAIAAAVARHSTEKEA